MAWCQLYLRSNLWLLVCLGYVAGSFLLKCDHLKHEGRRHEEKRMRSSGLIASLMKDYQRCTSSNTTKTLLKYYACIFKNPAMDFEKHNITDEEEAKLQTLWKCLKGTFKRFQEAVQSKR
ncbi:uncharacterized protein LOC144152594 isoform X2 [Haemaphysalis longicornis]